MSSKIKYEAYNIKNRMQGEYKMQFIKYCMLFFVFLASSLIGKYISQKYRYRLEELEEIKNTLNILKTKIKFTYEPIPEIFEEISNNTSENISKFLKNVIDKMNSETATIAWENSVDEFTGNLNQEDKQAIKTLSKLLGATDAEGQISQIDVTESFLEKQIQDASIEKDKNERLYKKLGTIIGLAIVIILI